MKKILVVANTAMFGKSAMFSGAMVRAKEMCRCLSLPAQEPVLLAEHGSLGGFQFQLFH